jgi:hypothetical protein
MSILFRLTPTYADGDGPASVIVKLAPPYPQVRQVAAGYKFYEREVRVYTELGTEIGFRPPKCWLGAHDPETDDFVLVLEDLRGHRVADQLAGCAPADARLIVGEMAKLHAAWWQSPRFAELPYLQSPADPPYPQFHDQAHKQSWPIVQERFGELIPDRIRRLGDHWEDIGAPIMLDAPNHPTTLTHGDVRLDNVFFRDEGDPVTVVDWQIAFDGVGAGDLAYFMSQSLTVDDRRAHEQELGRLYHDTLMAGGVRDYPFEEFWLDYRRSVLFDLCYPLQGGAVELVNDRAFALARTMLERSMAAIEDLDADELAPS